MSDRKSVSFYLEDRTSQLLASRTPRGDSRSNTLSNVVARYDSMCRALFSQLPLLSDDMWDVLCEGVSPTLVRSSSPPSTIRSLLIWQVREALKDEKWKRIAAGTLNHWLDALSELQAIAVADEIERRLKSGNRRARS